MYYSKVLLLLALTTDVFGDAGHAGPIGIEKSPLVGIIGGEPVAISQVPYMASVRLDGRLHWCGGSIIHEQFILTAAHCIVPKRKYKVAVGSDNIVKGALNDVVKILPHPRYSNVTQDYDICLMKLNEKLTFGPNVTAIQVGDKNTKLRSGMAFNATGWGLTKPKGKVSPELLLVSLPFVKRRVCQSYYFPKAVTGRMFCAGEYGKDTCSADSGGPLVINNVQVGITSFGAICGKGPAVYTKIPVLEPWIRHTIARNI